MINTKEKRTVEIEIVGGPDLYPLERVAYGFETELSKRAQTLPRSTYFTTSDGRSYRVDKISWLRRAVGNFWRFEADFIDSSGTSNPAKVNKYCPSLKTGSVVFL